MCVCVCGSLGVGGKWVGFFLFIYFFFCVFSRQLNRFFGHAIGSCSCIFRNILVVFIWYIYIVCIYFGIFCDCTGCECFLKIWAVFVAVVKELLTPSPGSQIIPILISTYRYIHVHREFCVCVCVCS